MNELVSIIVPVYNASNTLDRCIESLIKQTYINIEILLINDGSKDDSGKICDEWSFKDNRIKVIHKSNGGVSSARNSGFKESIGDYILCVDSDDYVSSNYVEIFMNAKKEYPNFGHYWSGIQMIHKDSNMIERYVCCEDEKYSFYDRNHIQTIMNKLPGLGPYAKLYKREVVEKYYLRMDENITLGEDELFNYEYLDKNINHKILLINETPYCYVRSNDGTLDTKYYPNLLDMLSSNNNVIEEYLKKWQVDKSQWKLFYNSKFYCYERIMKNTFRKENTLSFYGKLKFNSNIMISTDYRLTLSYFTGYMHPLYKWAYTSNSYIFVIIVELLVIIKKKLS